MQPVNPLHGINTAWNEKRFDDALASVRHYISNGGTQDAEAWFWLGKILWKLDRRNEAVSAYRTSSILDPEGPGKIALEHAEDISDFFNPDMYNP